MQVYPWFIFNFLHREYWQTSRIIPSRRYKIWKKDGPFGGEIKRAVRSVSSSGKVEPCIVYRSPKTQTHAEVQQWIVRTSQRVTKRNLNLAMCPTPWFSDRLLRLVTPAAKTHQSRVAPSNVTKSTSYCHISTLMRSPMIAIKTPKQTSMKTLLRTLRNRIFLA